MTILVVWAKETPVIGMPVSSMATMTRTDTGYANFCVLRTVCLLEVRTR